MLRACESEAFRSLAGAKLRGRRESLVGDFCCERQLVGRETGDLGINK